MLKDEQRLRRDQHRRGEVVWKVFPESQYTDAVFQTGLTLYPVLEAELSCPSHTGGTGFEAVKGHGEQLRFGAGGRVAVDENAAPVVTEDPSILEVPVPWDDHPEQEQCSGTSWSPELCVLQRAQERSTSVLSPGSSLASPVV